MAKRRLTPAQKRRRDAARAYVREQWDKEDISDKWIKTHIRTSKPRGVEMKYTSGGYGNFEDIVTRVVGSGIEDYDYIWYDDDTDLWHYGIDKEISS
jgi:hypothetical protein